MSGMDLVEFLNARLNEDERVAQLAAEATDHDWLTLTESSSRGERAFVSGRDNGDPVAECDGYPPLAVAAHIARHDPARVLADIAERRSIIYLLTDGCRIAYDRMAQANREVLHFLAHSYADHPDYRQEWGP